MKEIRKTENGIEIEVHLLSQLPASPYEFAVRRFMEGLITGDFSYFERDSDINLQCFRYGREMLQGRPAVIGYWEEWNKKIAESGKIKIIEEVESRYCSRPCLLVQHSMVIMFEIKDEKTTRIVATPTYLGARFSDTNMLNYPFEYNKIMPFLKLLEGFIDDEGKPIVLKNRVPCLKCNLESSDLTWYNIQIPAWAPNKWSQGQVSVCPRCGRVIEFEETKSITSDEERDVVNIKSKYSDEVNEYAEYAMSLFSKDRIGSLDQNNIDSFIRHIESKLTDLKIDEGWLLKLSLPDKSKDDDVSHLKVINEEGLETENIRLHCKIATTAMGAWQLYLIQRLFTILPTWGHGGCAQRNYIFKESDVEAIIPLKYHDLSKLKEEGKLEPSVEIVVTDNLFAVIMYCCYWNDWRGLVREKVSYLTQPNKAHIKDEIVNEEVLFQFHCGIYI